MHVDAGEIRGRAARTLEERIGPARIADTAGLEVTARDLPGGPQPFEVAVDGTFAPTRPGEWWGAP